MHLKNLVSASSPALVCEVQKYASLCLHFGQLALITGKTSSALSFRTPIFGFTLIFSETSSLTFPFNLCPHLGQDDLLFFSTNTQPHFGQNSILFLFD